MRFQPRVHENLLSVMWTRASARVAVEEEPQRGEGKLQRRQSLKKDDRVRRGKGRKGRIRRG